MYGLAVAVLGLSAGAVAGLAAADWPPAHITAAWIFGVALTVTAACAAAALDGRLLAATIGVAFGSGGALLSLHAWDQAWRSPLVLAFDREIGRQEAARPRGDGPGREPVRRSESPSLFAIVTGRLRSDAAVRGAHVSLSVAADALLVRERSTRVGEPTAASDSALPVSGGISVSVSGELARRLAPQWRQGRLVRFPVRLRRPVPHRNPGGGFDEARSLARRGTALLGSVKSGALVEVVARGSPWTELCGSVRAFTRARVARHVGRWDPRAEALVSAILIGDRAGLGPDVVRSLQEAGTYHTVAISGGNIAVLAALTLVLFRWSGVLGRGAMLTAIAGFLAFAGVVEGGASVTRAVVTAVVCFGARALDLGIAPPQAVLVAAGLLVAVDPLTVADPGFLLSFGATIGIVALVPGWSAARRSRADRSVDRTDRQSWRARLLVTAAPMVLASVAAEAVLLPIVATFFGRITVAGVALNVVAIPAMSVAQVAGMLLVPVSLVSDAMADLVGAVAAVAAMALLESSRVLEWLPRLSWRVAHPSGWVVCLYYASGAAVVWLMVAGGRRAQASPGWSARGRRPIGHASALALCGAAVWIAWEPWTIWAAAGDGRLHVLFMDVGQGDAVLVRFPRGDTMVVDAGGSRSDDFDVGDRIVAPVLKYFGLKRVGTLVLSHGDLDHAGGARAILRDFQPFEVWEGVPVRGWPLIEQLRRAAVREHVRWTNVGTGYQSEIDGVTVTVWHPDPPDWERLRPRNDDSLVLDLRWRSVSIVLTGDIGIEAERRIADRFGPSGIRVLKVPHHGSYTSSSDGFLDALRPSVAVVSAGAGNAFGHPAPAVIARYEARGAQVFQTARDGAVLVRTDGHALEVRAEGGRRAAIAASPRRPDARRP